MPPAFPPALRAVGCALAVAALGLAAPPAAAQHTPCDAPLAEAEARYVAQDYGAVEALVTDCVHHPEADTAAVTRAYRLLALAFVRQDLLAEAQAAIVKLLGVDFGYEPDPIQDPPLYVALVTAVKDQLRVAAPAPAADGFTVGGRVNVNTASAEVLESLDGIGPVLAGRIVAHRTTHGPFERVEELIEVRGIGPRTFERLAPYVTVEGPSTGYAAAGGLPADSLAAPPSPSPEAGEAVPPGSGYALLVDLNTASAPELQQLEGIGPVLAERIVAYREDYGPFERIEELMEVRGIGPSTYERVAPHLTVSPPED